jgi:hypothetical protein
MHTKVDLLDEDTPINGQKYVCMSFISPEKILKKKELYFFENFIKTYDFEKNNSKYNNFFQYISYKHDIKMEVLVNDYNDFLKLENENLKKKSFSLLDEYKNYMDKYEEKLLNDFNKDNNFETNTRGLKIRGTFDTEEKSNEHAKKIRKEDQHHDVFVGPVGVWIPWDPDPYKTGSVQYLEDDLQKLMFEKHKNEDEANEMFRERVKQSKEDAIRDNIEAAKKTNNKLTQNLNNESELVGPNTDFEENVNLLNNKIEL